MSVIDDYLSKVDEPNRTALERIRKFVISTVPEAEEVISYGMPGFKYKKKYLITFAAFKDHLSVFPGSHPVESAKSGLDGFKASKGTVQFTISKPLPDPVLKQLITVRRDDIDLKK